MCSCKCFLFATIAAIATLSVLVSQSNQTIIRLREQLWRLRREDIPLYECADLCGQSYWKGKGEEGCCKREDVESCKPIQSCFQQYINLRQFEINSLNMNLQYYIGLQTILFFVLLVNVYSVFYTCRLRQAGVAQGRQAIMASVLIQVQNIVQADHNAQQKRRRILTESFIEDGHDMCAVCLQTFGEQKVVRLKCKHLFHRMCIEGWMSNCQTCPVCRASQ